MRPKRVALWMPLPGGKIADVSIQRCGPAGIAEAVVYRLSERLRQHKDIQFLGNLNILEAIVINGRVVIPDEISNDLDLLLWYGEVGRKHGTFAMEILKAFASEGVQLIPDLGPFSTALDKHRSHACLRRAGLPVAETLLFDRGALVYAAKILQEWGKAVLKPRLGAFGKGVTLIEDPNVLRDFMDYIYIVGNEPNPDNGFFLERYYENDPQKWTSVTVINFKAVFAYRKKEEVFAPFGSGAKVYDRDEIGGRAECFPCEEAIASLAERAAKAIGSQIVGFDFILTANGPIIVDVNTYPGCYKEGFTIAGRDLAEEFFIMAELDIVGGKPLSLQTPQNVL